MAEGGFVSDDEVVGVAVPSAEHLVGGGLPVGQVLEGNDAAHANLVSGGLAEVGDTSTAEFFLELGLLRHEHRLVLLGHFVFGVLLEIAVLAGSGDGLGVLGNLFGNDLVVFRMAALVAFTGDQQRFFFALRIGGHEGLDAGEDFDEASEQRLLGQFLEALVEHQGVGQIAGDLGIGRGEEVGDQVGVLAQDVGQRNSSSG